jgi:probable HAF family extracellular repeat protein
LLQSKKIKRITFLKLLYARRNHSFEERIMKTVKRVVWLILALLILIAGVGVCEDADILDFLPAFIRAKFGNAVPTPFYLVPGVSTSVTITTYIPDANLMPESVQLKEGTAIIGNLTDSGNKVFSITTNFLRDKSGNINLSISATIGGVNKNIAQFNMPVLNLPSLQNTTQYNQNIDNIFSTLVGAKNNFTILKDESTTSEQSSHHLKLAKEKLLSVYANMEGIYRSETHSPSNFPRWVGYSSKYGELLQSANKLLDDRELFKKNPYDPRVADILAWAQSTFPWNTYLSTPDGRYEAAWYYQTHGADAPLQGTLKEANKIIVKQSTTQFTGLAGNALGDLFGGIKGKLIGKGINAAIGKIIDIFISKNGEMGLGLGEVQDGETLDIPAGSHDIIFSFKGVLDRAILRYIMINADASFPVNIAPGEVKVCKFTYQDLGTLGGTDSSAYGINDNGWVVGSSNIDTEMPRAFLWTPSDGMKDLGTLIPGYGYSWASSINNVGKVVGITSTANAANAFLWTLTGGIQDLGTIGGYTGGGSYAAGINNNNQVVGESYSPNGQLRAFLWTSTGGMQDLGTLGGTLSRANSINDIGQVVGMSWIDTNGTNRPFLWTTSEGMKNLNTLVNLPTYAAALIDAKYINNNGIIVGFFEDHRSGYWIGPTFSAFSFSSQDGFKSLWQNGTPQAINDMGQVVGSLTGVDYSSHAVIWDPGSGVQDLNNLTINLPAMITLWEARAINNVGQIAVIAYNTDTKKSRAFLLTPQLDAAN